MSDVDVKPLTAAQIDAILGIGATDVKGGLFNCSRCKTKEHTTYTMIQDRSGDEGSTAYVRCIKCKKRWKERV